jgi:hypothetical protein
MLGLQYNKQMARTFKTQHSGPIRQVLPFCPGPADEDSAARTVRRFMATELVFRHAITVEVNSGSIIVRASRARIAFQLM